MPFHIAAFLGAQGGAVTNTALPALTDGFVPISSSGNFLFQRDFRLTWAQLISDASAANFRFNTPKYRFVSIPSFNPIAVYAGGQLSAIGSSVYLEPPFLTVPKLDEFSMEITTGGASTINTIGLVNAHDGNFTIPQGDIYTLRATATITAAASVWTRGNITFDQTLPAGRYSVVGGAGFGTTLRAWRLRFNEYVMLPGCFGAPAITASGTEYRHRYGRQGEWGQFDQTSQPTVEILCTAADTAQTFLLDVIKIR